MNDALNLAIKAVNESDLAYCKSITPNDVGETGSHQSGFHIHKEAWALGLSKPGEKGENIDIHIEIRWQGDFITKSGFKYYGKASRNEYRITRFGKGFPFLQKQNIGDLLVLCKMKSGLYEAFVFSTEDDIESFLASVGIDVGGINKIIPKSGEALSSLESFYSEFIEKLEKTFPSSSEISNYARDIYNKLNGINNASIQKDADKIILKWVETEYALFKAIENHLYAHIISKKFDTVDQLIEISNTILNRRKSRAGKSLEHHLEQIFTANALRFETQAKTEENKKPDFLFPGSKEYKDLKFAFEHLTFLGAKTTCKDRWRQILNEADRIPSKHLFTLQQGISANQLAEMKKEKVVLVIPKENFGYYPEIWRRDIMSLESFIGFVRSKQY